MIFIGSGGDANSRRAVHRKSNLHPASGRMAAVITETKRP